MPVCWSCHRPIGAIENWNLSHHITPQDHNGNVFPVRSTLANSLWNLWCAASWSATEDELPVVFTNDCTRLWHTIEVLWGAWQCGNYIWCRTCNEPLTVYAECSAPHAWLHWYDFLITCRTLPDSIAMLGWAPCRSDHCYTTSLLSCTSLFLNAISYGNEVKCLITIMEVWGLW